MIYDSHLVFPLNTVMNSTTFAIPDNVVTKYVYTSHVKRYLTFPLERDPEYVTV